MNNSILDFFACFPITTVTCYVEDKHEVCCLLPLASPDSPYLKYWYAEEGCAFSEFLYDPLFDQVVGFLMETPAIIKEIRSSPSVDSWKYFYRFIKELYYCKNLHPFYYLVLSETVNACKRDFKDALGNPLPEDYFLVIAEYLQTIKNDTAVAISTCFDREDASSCASDLYFKSGLYKPVDTKHFYLELVPSTPNNKDIIKFDSVLHPETLLDHWFYLLSKHLQSDLLLKRCNNCMRYFIATGRGNVKYCDRIVTGTGKTCRQLMPNIVSRKKTDSNVAEKLYLRAYKTMFARDKKGLFDKGFLKKWSKEARSKRDDCVGGKISAEEFPEWLCDNGLNIDYLKDM